MTRQTGRMEGQKAKPKKETKTETNLLIEMEIEELKIRDSHRGQWRCSIDRLCHRT
jgi:hypothetical protein